MSKLYIGDELKRLRNRANETRDEVANALGISMSTYEKWERNERPCNDKEHIKNILNHFGVGIEALGSDAEDQFEAIMVISKIEPDSLADVLVLLNKKIKDNKHAQMVLAIIVAFGFAIGFAYQEAGRALFVIFASIAGAVWFTCAKDDRARKEGIIMMFCGSLVGISLLTILARTFLTYIFIR